MKTSLKNTLKTTSSCFFFSLAKLSFTALFFVAYARTLATKESIFFFNEVLMTLISFIALSFQGTGRAAYHNE